MTPEPLLDVRELCVHFHGSNRNAVDRIGLRIRPGERMGLVGESGSGKTVTAMAISGLIERNKTDITGEVFFDGNDLLSCSRARLRDVQGPGIGVVFQEPMTSLNPLMRVGRQVEEVLRLPTDKTPAECRALALEALELVGLPDPEGTYKKFPHQLSGGQRQRACIAAACVIHPKLLICDEPTTALDVTVQAQIMQLLRGLSEEFGTAILLISHDLSVVRRLCDSTAVMYRGHIVEEGRVEDIFERPQDEYTRRLIAAIPKRERRDE